MAPWNGPNNDDDNGENVNNYLHAMLTITGESKLQLQVYWQKMAKTSRQKVKQELKQESLALASMAQDDLPASSTAAAMRSEVGSEFET